MILAGFYIIKNCLGFTTTHSLNSVWKYWVFKIQTFNSYKKKLGTVEINIMTNNFQKNI